MPAKRTAIFNHGRSKQRGVALLIMLVILVVGIAAVLVNSLTSSTVKMARQETTVAALAQAKDALIGRAIADATSPGSLPCPDTDDDGSAELFSGTNCPSYIGRLPWGTLGLPDLRDGSGERLWYALSPNFRDHTSVASINSDSQGTLNITGTTTASNVIAIVFAPGPALSTQNQSRSSINTITCTTLSNASKAENLCATNYLEGSNPNLSTATTPNTAYQTAAASSAFNDQMIFITHDQLFAAVEKRIAREAKSCLDNYAAASANKYPWAAPVSDTTSYASTYNTFFGRLSTTPSNATSGSTDSSMSTTWPSSCTILTSSYWTSWRNLVFYQIANGYQPGGSANCVGCLSISGSGNTAAGSGTYRAAVLVARRAIGTQARTSPATDPPTPYLEGNNPHSGSTPTTTFETYNSSDLNYPTVNDLVLCLDGKNNCK